MCGFCLQLWVSVECYWFDQCYRVPWAWLQPPSKGLLCLAKLCNKTLCSLSLLLAFSWLPTKSKLASPNSLWFHMCFSMEAGKKKKKTKKNPLWDLSPTLSEGRGSTSPVESSLLVPCPVWLPIPSKNWVAQWEWDITQSQLIQQMAYAASLASFPRLWSSSHQNPQGLCSMLLY